MGSRLQGQIWLPPPPLRTSPVVLSLGPRAEGPSHEGWDHCRFGPRLSNFFLCVRALGTKECKGFLRGRERRKEEERRGKGGKITPAAAAAAAAAAINPCFVRVKVMKAVCCALCVCVCV